MEYKRISPVNAGDLVTFKGKVTASDQNVNNIVPDTVIIKIGPYKNGEITTVTETLTGPVANDGTWRQNWFPNVGGQWLIRVKITANGTSVRTKNALITVKADPFESVA